MFAPLNPWEEDHLRIAQTVATDTEEMYMYLNRLITNANLRKEMGDNARRHIVENYDWRIIVARVNALWNELVSIAAHLPPLQKPMLTLERPRYYSNYQHFATKTLTGAERVDLTDWGHSICKDTTKFYIPPFDAGLFSPKVAIAILRFVRIVGRFGVHLTIDELIVQVQRKHNLSKDKGYTHLLWLLKYGLICITE